jgi:hypothetical protein
VTQAKVQRVGVYLRVSAVDQEAQNQLLQLQALCDQQDYKRALPDSEPVTVRAVPDPLAFSRNAPPLIID